MIDPTPRQELTEQRVAQIEAVLQKGKENTADKQLSLSDILYLALRQNARLQLLQSQIDEKASERSALLFDGLPSVDLSADVTRRTPPETATDSRIERNRSATASLNLEQLLTSYAGQLRNDADRDLVLLKFHETANKIAFEALTHYARIINAKQIRKEIQAMRDELASAQEKSIYLSDNLIQDPLISLNYQNGMLSLDDNLRRLDEQISRSEIALLSTISYQFDGTISAIGLETNNFVKTLANMERSGLIAHALRHRPDLLQGDVNVYKSDISLEEAAWDFLPKLSVDFSTNYDSSLENDRQDYVTQKFDLGVSIIKLLKSPYVIESAKQKKLQSELTALTKNLEAVKEIDESRQHVNSSFQAQISAQRKLENRRQLFAVRNGRVIQSEQEELDLVRAQMDAAIAGVEFYNSRIQSFQAAIRLFAAAGMALYPQSVIHQGLFPEDEYDEKRLKQAIQEHIKSLLKGDFTKA